MKYHLIVFDIERLSEKLILGLILLSLFGKLLPGGPQLFARKSIGLLLRGV